MTVSLGDFDSLLGESFPVSDVTGLSIDSFTTLTTPNVLGVASISVTTNPEPALGTTAGAVLTVVAVNDQDDTLTFSVANGGSSTLQTDWVLGLDQNALLLSQGGEGLTEVYLQLISGDASSIDAGILSNAPIPAQTPLTFTVAGTSDITPASGPALRAYDASSGAPVTLTPSAYTGPVAGLVQQYINGTTENLAIFATTPGWFIATGNGDNAITVGSGDNVLDAGTGSALMTGGSGTDTFFLDDRSPAADIWDTANNFHIGDTMTLWGVTPQDFSVNWLSNAGAPGFDGLTLTVSAAGHPNASVTFANNASLGVSLANLSVTYGVEKASGLAYMNIQAVST
jgi:hypothetical protein